MSFLNLLFLYTFTALSLTTFKVNSAASNSAISPPDAASCARSITKVSCQGPEVDPNSFATCCTNGALNSNLPESGLVLSTQFWDLTTGPHDSTTIHGLWPDYCDGTYPGFCSTTSGIPEKNGDQIKSLIQKYDPNLLNYMAIYYENDPSFWSHEYNKHGTCFTTLRGKCQFTANPYENATSTALVGYFQQIVHQFQQLPTYNWLSQSGITPSTTKTYQLIDFQNALKSKFGKTPYIGCTKNSAGVSTFSEVWYYYNVRGQLVNGQYIPVESTTKSTCGSTLTYPPKTD